MATTTEETAVLAEDALGMDGVVRDAVCHDLKRSTTRGALVSLVGQSANFVLRTGSMVIMARLLTPKDFGLVGMVAAVTGFLGLFRDLGLSMATVQRDSVTNAQTSTLFWINVAVGGGLALMCVLLAPALAAFYSEPRLFWVTAASGTSFLFNGAAAQHRAILQRGMRFLPLAIIDIVSLVSSLAAGVGMALAGTGYWALVAAAVCQQAMSLAGVCCATRWIPGRFQRRSGVRSMLWFGGTVTLNSVIAFLAYNIDKVLVGRFYGAEALGVYGRAFQLINLPTENLTSTIGLVAFPALARVQNEPSRLRNYFIKGYSSSLSLVLPITVACALFSEDIVSVFLGAKWQEAAPIFRLLAPTILAFAVVNPFGWLMLATGRAGRSLKIGLVIAPVVVLGYVLGLRYGPRGVAVGFSASMVTSVVPLALWAKRGTLITTADLLAAVMRPGLSVVIGAAATLPARGVLGLVHPVFFRLALEIALLSGVYLLVLLFVFKQKEAYAQLLREAGLWPSRGNGRTDQST
jgi:O-antigen/teichoic acid export membrane protein